MAGPLNWFSQIASVSKVSLQTIVERKGSSAASTFGIAGVVAVLVGVLSIAQGFRQAMKSSGVPGRARISARTNSGARAINLNAT